MRTSILAALCLLLATVATAAETFDGVTIEAPAGWTRTEGKDFVAFERKTATTYALVALYRSRAATAGSIEAEFDAEWPDLVTKTQQAPAPKKRTTSARDGGVAALSGKTTKTNLAGTTTWLHVFVAGGRVSSIVASTSDPAAFLPAIEAFIASVQFPPPGTVAAPTAVAAAHTGDPEVSADPARLPGRYKRTISAANLMVTYWDPSYSRKQYDFKADGTYVFSDESWQQLTPDDFWFVEESGTWKLDGGTLTVRPKKSTVSVKSKAGALKKSEKRTLEEVSYLWHFRYFSGNKETSLILKPSKETARDGLYSSLGIEPDSYAYTRDK